VIAEVIFAVFWALSLTTTLLFVGARMVHIGLGVEPARLAALIRDRAFLARALLANLVVVPGLGIAIAMALPLPAEAATALLLVAAVGGGIDPLAPADRPTADTAGAPALVFVLSAVAILTVPGLHVLLQPAGTSGAGSLWRSAGIAVLGALVPLLAGALVRRRLPALAGVLSRVMGIVATVFFAVAALTTFLVKAPSLRAIGGPAVLAMALLVVASAAAGWLLGGPSAGRRAVLARVTAMRNVGLGLLLAIAGFPNTGVDVAVLLFAVVETTLRAMAILAAWRMMPADPMSIRRGRRP
jgi:BASS family bile acid:Na+ symporter